MMKFNESKLKPKLQIADAFLGITDVDTEFATKFMEEQMELRSKPIEAHIKKNLQR